MKRCLKCQFLHPSSDIVCPKCMSGPEILDGFEAYAPTLAYEGEGFKPSYFSELSLLEAGNFWFEIRNKIILSVINKYGPHFESLLEVGCGTGYVLLAICQRFHQSKLYGSEILTAGLSFASMRVQSAKFMQMDARNIPYEEEFDIVGAFDVLEHVKEDGLVLQQIHASLRRDGLLILTVPQHQWLWSSVDNFACHQRRYSKFDIHQKLKNSGFMIIKSTSFMFFLLPAMMLSRFLQDRLDENEFDAGSELKISSWLNRCFYAILWVEWVLIKAGVSLPIGGSRLIVARKN